MRWSKLALNGLFGVCACFVFLVGCGESEYSDSDNSCGSGDMFAHEGQEFCIYTENIIEEGFRCPEDVPFMHELDGFTACAPEQGIPEGFEESVHELDDYQPNNASNGTSNGTSNTSNGTVSTSNGTTSTSNGTSSNNSINTCAFGDAGCVCRISEEGAMASGNFEGAACTRQEFDSGFCACSRAGVLGTSNGTTSTSNGTSTPNGNTDVYRYVLLEDMGTDDGGEHPGSDMDAVSVVKDGVERFAASVEEDNVFHNGTSIDTTQILGPPNSNCEAENFVSLGGVENNGWIIVGFSDAATEYTFGPGDVINVYELGPATCSNQPNWLNDPYNVSVSVGNTMDQFTSAGIATASGTNTFVVP